MSAGLGGSGDLLALAVDLAGQALPGEAVEVYAARGRTTTVRAYGGEVEQLVSASSAGVGVRVVAGGRQGYASCGTLDPRAVRETLADARDNAAYGQEDPCLGVARPDGVTPPELSLWRPGLEAFPAEQKVALALELERATLAADPRVRGVRVASWGDGAGEVAVATSTGIAAHSAGTSCWLSVQALAADGDETTTGVGVALGREPGDLDVAAVAAEGAERAVGLLGAVKPASCRVTAVFEPRVAATLVGIVAGMLGGDRVAKGRTPFADRLGEAVASPLLTLIDDPTDVRSLGAAPFDGEGLACRPTRLVEAGTLAAFLHDTTSACRCGARSTASAVRGVTSPPGVGAQALAVAPGALDAAAVLGAVGDGLLVQSLTGVHSGVNPTSGDFSVGVEGRWIRNGVPAEAVRGVTLASTLPRMLLDLVAVGSDVAWQVNGTAAVSLAVEGMSLAGT